MLRKTYNSYLFVYKIQQRFCPIFIDLIFLVLYYFAMFVSTQKPAPKGADFRLLDIKFRHAFA